MSGFEYQTRNLLVAIALMIFAIHGWVIAIYYQGRQ